MVIGVKRIAQYITGQYNTFVFVFRLFVSRMALYNMYLERFRLPLNQKYKNAINFQRSFVPCSLAHSLQPATNDLAREYNAKSPVLYLRLERYVVRGGVLCPQHIPMNARVNYNTAIRFVKGKKKPGLVSAGSGERYCC